MANLRDEYGENFVRCARCRLALNNPCLASDVRSYLPIRIGTRHLRRSVARVVHELKLSRTQLERLGAVCICGVRARHALHARAKEGAVMITAVHVPLSPHARVSPPRTMART